MVRVRISGSEPIRGGVGVGLREMWVGEKNNTTYTGAFGKLYMK